MTVPIAPMLPLQREARWSDLLAVLIAMEPQSASALGAARDVVVQREVSRGDVRADLLLSQDAPVVIEVKVLSDLHPDQLPALRHQFPEARHVLIHPRHLGVSLGEDDDWDVLTWEEVLTPFASSTDEWVARTASGWLAHLAGAIPPVVAETHWAADSGTDFAGALRTRMTWVYRAMQPPEGVGKDLVTAGAGKKAVARLWRASAVPGYQVMIEAEERLAVYDFPRRDADQATVRARGPAVRITLVQLGVSTSRAFDWDLLHTMWRHVEGRRDDWITTSPRPKAAHDRAGLQRIVEKGAPRFIGQGFGDAWARTKQVCQFGPRFQLDADVTLAEVADVMHEMGLLIRDLSAIVGAHDPS